MSAYRICTLFIALLLAGAPLAANAQTTDLRDAQRDFDFELGEWTTHVRVLRNPLSGQPPDWAEYSGVSRLKPLLDGRANFVELDVRGPNGRIEGGSLRLFNPKTRQWSLNYASLADGVLTAPVHGGFGSDTRGTFYGQDSLAGRVILVRFTIIPISPNEIRFEQAYSVDGGSTWELNWLAVDRRR